MSETPGTYRKRLLFVDDEAQVLKGLEHILRKHRKQWEMVFVLSGEDALALMEREPFDVVVSDMRMPGMDGAQLLTHVKELYPTTVRLILSGHAEKEAMVRALPVAHQFLNKPCDADSLRNVIERTWVVVNGLLGDPIIGQLVGRIDNLPSTPRVYSELLRTAADPYADLKQLSGVVEQDPAVSARVLQLVNSAYFGVSQPITSIHQAVVYLGIEVLKALVVSTSVFSILESNDGSGFSFENFQNVALATARVAKRLVPDPAVAGEAFTAALLHDLGQVVMSGQFAQQYQGVMDTFVQTKAPLEEIERSVFGASHAEVGAYLLSSWGLPFMIVEQVAYHHRPAQLAQGVTKILAAVHLADVLVSRVLQPQLGADEGLLDLDYVARSGLKQDPRYWDRVVQEEVMGEQGK